MKFRIYARPQILSIFVVEANSEQEAIEKHVQGLSVYRDKDYSDDHLTTEKENIISIEQIP